MTTAVAEKPAVPVQPGWNARDLIALCKPRVTNLVVFTGVTGLHVAPGPIPLAKAFWMLLGCVLLVASANVLNCYLERDSDQLMARTRTRPLPAGRVEPRYALWWGLLLFVVSMPMLWLGANALTAILGLIAHLGYVLVYTPLKRRSAWNTVIGAVPGAMPPLMGWTAVTGSLDLGGIMLFMVLFIWQLPHTLAIGLFRKTEYEKAGIRVVPVAMGDRASQIQVFFTTLLLVPVAVSFHPLGIAGMPYLAVACALTAVFVGLSAGGLSKSANNKWARGIFIYSMTYLALLLVALSLDVLFR